MMKLMSRAKIFLADQRGLTETKKLRRFSTFNFEKFTNPDKEPLDGLYLWNEDMLAKRQKTCFEVDRDSNMIIIPITGSVNYLDDTENETDIEVEEIAVVYVERGANITLSNPFDNDTIHYLCIGINANEPLPNNPQFFYFDLAKQNKLMKIDHSSLPFSMSIGRFTGRKEVVYQISPDKKLYAFVISGAFEMDGRLLHQGDGIALWETDEIEIEALSDNAVVLALEMNC
jgi:hypothetical protein